ncbi:NlpC/P60 family protein [Flavobacterium sp.]|jgi:cell wall-associated NlpC family hydrolase|uniref:NlpC/P60 family protein n=1 Tax=Flavobacterium sp. TaxID=239 RepID=UPI0037C06000
MANKLEIVEHARAYIGTPFKHQGRLKGVGVDCAGLCINVMKELDYEIIDVKAYDRVPNGNLFDKIVNANLKRKHFEDVEPGDFLTFNFDQDPQHIAVVSEVNPLKIIHSYQKAGRVVEHYADNFWLSRIVATYEAKEDDNHEDHDLTLKDNEVEQADGKEEQQEQEDDGSLR